MVSRCKYSGSPEIGVYCLLTNKYALIPYSNNSFITHFIEDPSEIPIIQTSVSSTNIIGRIAVGNKHGLLLPSTTAQYEIQNIHSQMPDGVVIETVDEPFSALGNVISANDKIALVNPDLDEETMESIANTLLVEVVPFSINKDNLIGTYTKFTNIGGVVCQNLPIETVEEINKIVGLELVPCSVNRGSSLVSSGICVNDNHLICGTETTALEIATLTRAFHMESIDKCTLTNRKNNFSYLDILI